MPNTQKYKHTCRLWRVNIDGKVYEGRWKHAGGAIAAAYQRHTDARDEHGHLQLDEHGKTLPAKDFTDVVIHIECIGEPLEPYVKFERPATRELDNPRPGSWNALLGPSTQPRQPHPPVYLSSEEQRTLMTAWHQIVGGTPCQIDGHMFGGAAACERCGVANNGHSAPNVPSEEPASPLTTNDTDPPL